MWEIIKIVLSVIGIAALAITVVMLALYGWMVVDIVTDSFKSFFKKNKDEQNEQSE